MIILRHHLFSSSESENKKDKEDGEKRRKKEKLKGAGLIAAGSIGTIGGIKASHKLNRVINEKLSKLELADMARGYLNKEEYNKVLRNLRKKSSELGIKLTITDTINHTFDNPSSLAHEMGHASMSKKGRSKDVIGKVAHSKFGDSLGSYFDNATNQNSNSKESKILKHASRGLFLGDGIRRGIKSSKQEEHGDTKKAKRTRRNALLISGLSAAPTLIKEASASRKGIKYLKEAGASKRMLKNSRRELRHAFGTYASNIGIPISLEVGGTAIGYGAHKLISKSKNKKKVDENKDKKEKISKD